jgi:hypothetical protein
MGGGGGGLSHSRVFWGRPGLLGKQAQQLGARPPSTATNVPTGARHNDKQDIAPNFWKKTLERIILLLERRMSLFNFYF